MDRLTKKLKKGGYSANRRPEAELQERLDQFMGVHQYWMEQVQEMEQGIGQASDMGPEGGRGGGQVVATGTPEQLAQSTTSITARFLKQEL